MTRAAPLPLNVAETKIHPSLERESAKGWLDFETEDTASNSETRLFSFLSPVKRISACAASPRLPMRIMNEAISLAVISGARNGRHRLSSQSQSPAMQ